jgi:predicted short-subunit dehydrogenase-like oxidoreductase (DUF2520 family)
VAKITLIGSGKTATALGHTLKGAGHTIIQVWSKTIEGASELAKKIQATATSDLKAINNDADIYLIAVNDDAIEDVARQLNTGNKIIAHTSGIRSKSALTTVSENYGVFYPFVSMTKESKTDFRKALLMIEGSNEQTIKTLMALAESISDNVKTVQENQRQSLHLAAVFAHNFTNYMYVAAEQILADKGLKFDDLRPLIAAHIANIQQLSPSTLQTGPAIRHDSSTIEAHLHLLYQHNELQQLYVTMTEAIQTWHKDK